MGSNGKRESWPPSSLEPPQKVAFPTSVLFFSSLSKEFRLFRAGSGCFCAAPHNPCHFAFGEPLPFRLPAFISLIRTLILSEDPKMMYCLPPLSYTLLWTIGALWFPVRYPPLASCLPPLFLANFPGKPSPFFGIFFFFLPTMDVLLPRLESLFRIGCPRVPDAGTGGLLVPFDYVLAYPTRTSLFLLGEGTKLPRGVRPTPVLSYPSVEVNCWTFHPPPQLFPRLVTPSLRGSNFKESGQPTPCTSGVSGLRPPNEVFFSRHRKLPLPVGGTPGCAEVQLLSKLPTPPLQYAPRHPFFRSEPPPTPGEKAFTYSFPFCCVLSLIWNVFVLFAPLVSRGSPLRTLLLAFAHACCLSRWAWSHVSRFLVPWTHATERHRPQIGKFMFVPSLEISFLS